MIAFGLRILRLPPSALWTLTPVEIAAALRAGGGNPPARAEFDALFAAFPDEV